MACVYDRQSTKTSSVDSPAPRSQTESQLKASPASAPFPSPSPPSTHKLPESRERRLLELKLMHHYAIKTGLSISLSVSQTWTDMLPRLALTNDALLFGMCAISAFHLSKTDPLKLLPDAPNAHQTYLDLAIREHSKDVSKLTKSNADATCLTSSMIRIAAYIQLHERSMEPYSPPTQWMQTTRGTCQVFQAAWNFIGYNDSSTAFRLTVQTPEVTSPATLYTEPNRQSLMHLMRRNEYDEKAEIWSEGR